MKPARFSSHASASVSHELMEGVLSAVTAAKVADQNVVTALRARFASAPVTTRHEQPLRHSERALLSLWEAIVGMSHGDHGVGALLALHADDSAWGVAGEVLRQTPTLLDAYAQIERYSRLVHQGVTITIELSPSDIILRYRHTKNSPEQATGALAAGVLWAVSNLALVPMRWFDVSIRPIATALSCTAPAHMDPVTNVFGPSVSFNAAHPLLVYDRAEVEKACRPADTRILACLGALAERELDELPLMEDIKAVVALELQSRLVGGAPTIDVVARSLGLSVRTLQRRITNAGSTFAMILDDVRKGRAKQLIQSQTRSLGEVAYMLGYSEQAALSRAARRWFGVSPTTLTRF